jgi:hypothetical protein
MCCAECRRRLGRRFALDHPDIAIPNAPITDEMMDRAIEQLAKQAGIPIDIGLPELAQLVEERQAAIETENQPNFAGRVGRTPGRVRGFLGPPDGSPSASGDGGQTNVDAEGHQSQGMRPVGRPRADNVVQDRCVTATRDKSVQHILEVKQCI